MGVQYILIQLINLLNEENITQDAWAFALAPSWFQETSSSGCRSDHFSKKPYPSPHTQCSQVSFNEELPKEVVQVERATQVLTILLRQNSKDNTESSEDSVSGRWPGTKKQETWKSRELILSKAFKVDSKGYLSSNHIIKSSPNLTNYGCFVCISKKMSGS